VHLYPFSVGDSFRLRAEIDAVSETADVYVYDLHGGLLASATDVPAWPHQIPADWPPSDPFGVPITLDQIGIAVGGAGAGGNGVVYVDDVSVRVVPEPLTVLGVLLGVGGLGRYVRRRLT
jgi:hypothetical protein